MSLKNDLLLLFWNSFKRSQGQHSLPAFPKANRETPSFALEFGGTVPPPSCAAAVKASYGTLLGALFPTSQQPPVHWVPVLPVPSSSPTTSQLDEIFCLPARWPELLWLTSPSYIFCIHRRCHGTTHLEFMHKANQQKQKGSRHNRCVPIPTGSLLLLSKASRRAGLQREGWLTVLLIHLNFSFVTASSFNLPGDV